MGIGRFNSQCQIFSWEVSRSIVLETSLFKTTPKKLITKKHENLISKNEDLFIDSKQRSPQEIEKQRSIRSLQTGIPRDTKIWGRNYNELQIVFISWRYEDQEPKLDINHHSKQQQLIIKIIESHQRLRLVGLDSRKALIRLVHINRQFSPKSCRLDGNWKIQQPVSDIFVGGL